MTSCTESARQNRKSILRRGGTRRAVPRYAFASLFTTDRERAGTPRLHGGILSIARSTARAFPPSDFSRGKGWAGKWTEERRSFLRHDVASHHPVSLEIASKLLATKHRRSQLVFPLLVSQTVHFIRHPENILGMFGEFRDVVSTFLGL